MSVEKFLDRLADFDPDQKKRRDEAEAKGEVLRYVGVVGAEGPAVVELRSYPASHAFARVAPGDNIFSFRTARYATQPLIVQGPGAGPEVTAGGVFADLLRLMSYLGAPS
jgi:aspartokinase/homoserine dehydrogenase 1